MGTGREIQSKRVFILFKMEEVTMDVKEKGTEKEQP